jgi:predicted alpha/beta-hydrolase family hydrolase
LKNVPPNISKFDNPPVSGFLHRPARDLGPGLAITHGAGANCASPLLIAIADAFCSAGYFLLRFDLPFSQRRAFGAPHPSAAEEDRAGIRAAVECMRSLASERVYAGGHSYGGRQATMLAAEDPSCCDALLLLSYPLHPPNKPNQLRTAHFATLRNRALFVQGTADPFGSMDEMRAAVQLIPARTELVFIERAGHDLNRGKFDIPRLLVEPFERVTR